MSRNDKNLWICTVGGRIAKRNTATITPTPYPNHPFSMALHHWKDRRYCFASSPIRRRRRVSFSSSPDNSSMGTRTEKSILLVMIYFCGSVFGGSGFGGSGLGGPGFGCGAGFFSPAPHPFKLPFFFWC